MACVGVPQLIITQNQRHIANAKKMDEDGAATCLGTAEQVQVTTLRDTVNYVLDDQLERIGMARCARMMIDGRGPDRIVNGLEILIHTPSEAAPLRLAA
jgi:spore coat polysaccharide biosynthesis predicted glycosyltransferase SpsG